MKKKAAVEAEKKRPENPLGKIVRLENEFGLGIDVHSKTVTAVEELDDPTICVLKIGEVSVRVSGKASEVKDLLQEAAGQDVPFLARQQDETGNNPA